MNRVTCSVCGETAIESPLLAEQLEGLGICCTHCGALGRVALFDNDEGGVESLELVQHTPRMHILPTETETEGH